MYKKGEDTSKYLKHKNFDPLGKPTDGFKCSLNDSSGDSGFISNENLLVSEEIASEEIQSDNASSKPSVDSGVEEMKEDAMDSGLVESFSSLNVTSLNSSGIKGKSTEAHQKSKLKIQEPIAKIFDRPWNIYYQQNDAGNTYLHLAIAQGFVEVALSLIKAAPHCTLLDTPNDKAQTPLHFAVGTAQSRIARWLVVAGVRPCPRNLIGDSPLHVAARMGDVKCVKAIADPVEKRERDALGLKYKSHKHQTCNLDQWNYLGETCVHVAALQGHVDVLRQLVRHGADINAREGRTGYTALHYAVERRDEATLQFLLQCDQLDVEVETYGGQTALDIDPLLPSSISKALKNRGVSSSFFSDESDYDEGDSEDSGD